MPKGGKPTMLTCENCGTLFQKKYQGKVTNRWCCRECRDEFLAKEKIAIGNYTKATAFTFFKRFTEYKCIECGNTGTHKGKPLSLQIDHIDGNNNNNVIENLRYLCPNCHSQTDTWGVKNVSEEGRKRLKAAAKLGNDVRLGRMPKGSKLVS
jgi:5-methylcytosine-specific restriction endonuclease McrA